MLKEHTLYRFGEWTLDPVAKVLFRDGEPVHLTRKAVETLLVLVEHAGQVLTREEIMSAVWGDRVVDDANLAQNIAVVRKMLGAAKGSPAWIETFPGRGYRLEGPVTAETRTPAPVPEPAAPAPPAPPSQWRKIPAMVAVAGGLLLAIAAMILWLRPARPDDPAPFRVTPVTRLAGKEYQPAISPDGTTIAFLWSEDGTGTPAVWISPAGESTPQPLTKAPGHYGSPAWSPDGKSLAFLRVGRTGTDVVTMTLADGREKLIASVSPPDYGFDSQLLDWSPDGKWLALSHAEAEGKPLGILLVSVDSGAQRWLTRPDRVFSGDLNPRFSPDGTRVSFVRMLHRSQQDLYQVPVSGGEPVRLTNFGRRISGQDWLPDSSGLIVASDKSGEFRLWRLAIRGGEAQPLGIYGEFPIQLTLARKAQALTYAALHQDRNIWRFGLADNSWKRVIASTAQDASPVYSPDGTRICFRSDRSGEEQLWVAAADGSAPVQITRGNLRPSVGRWSPDGRRIVFNNPVTAEIFVASEDARGWTVSGTGARGAHPVFSADGRWIFAGGSTTTRIPALGGPPVTVLNSRSEALFTSPDGQFLYYAPDSSTTSVWRVPLAGGTPEKVVDGLVRGCTSCFAVASDGVYYLGTENQSFDRQALYFQPFGGRAPARLIAPYPEPLWPQGSGPLSLAPDRKSLLCVRMAPSDSDAMLVRPFR